MKKNKVKPLYLLNVLLHCQCRIHVLKGFLRPLTEGRSLSSWPISPRNSGLHHLACVWWWCGSRVLSHGRGRHRFAKWSMLKSIKILDRKYFYCLQSTSSFLVSQKFCCWRLSVEYIERFLTRHTYNFQQKHHLQNEYINVPTFKMKCTKFNILSLFFPQTLAVN